jgi:hypothetical protein
MAEVKARRATAPKRKTSVPADPFEEAAKRVIAAGSEEAAAERAHYQWLDVLVRNQNLRGHLSASMDAAGWAKRFREYLESCSEVDSLSTPPGEQIRERTRPLRELAAAPREDESDLGALARNVVRTAMDQPDSLEEKLAIVLKFEAPKLRAFCACLAWLLGESAKLQPEKAPQQEVTVETTIADEALLARAADSASSLSRSERSCAITHWRRVDGLGLAPIRDKWNSTNRNEFRSAEAVRKAIERYEKKMGLPKIVRTDSEKILSVRKFVRTSSG